MENKTLSFETGNKVLAMAKKLASLYPQHFIFEDDSSGLFHESQNFYMNTLHLGSFHLFEFKTLNDTVEGSNFEVVIPYRDYAFIDFFVRMEYINKYYLNQPQLQDLAWLTLWSNFFIWNSGVKNTYSSDPMELVSLSLDTRSKRDKLQMLIAGLFKKKDLEQYSEVPLVYIKRMFDVPDLEKLMLEHRAIVVPVDAY